MSAVLGPEPSSGEYLISQRRPTAAALVHSIAVAVGVAQGFPTSAMLTYFRDLPKAYGFGLPVVYLVWLSVVAALYPVCRRYATHKARSRAWWLSYL